MKRRFDYDVLRVASMLGVIFLHSASGALLDLNNGVLWGFSNVLTAISTPAVPLFFMMSGALLLNSEKTDHPKDILLRRIPKVLVPLLCWSGLVLLYNFLRVDRAAALESLKYIFNTPVMVPYWFLYGLIPMYLLSPMLKRMTDGLNGGQWNYMMALWAILTLGLNTVRAFLPFEWQYSFTAHMTLNINALGGYLGYFLLGAYLEQLERRPSRRVLAAGTVGMLLVSIVGTYWDSYSRGAYSDRFTNYLNIFTMLLSAFIFLLAKDCLGGREEKGRLLPWLANASFGVYLAHAPAIMVMQKLWLRLGYPAGPWDIPSMLVFHLGVTLSCILGVAVVSLIPGVCYLATGQRWRFRREKKA